MTTVIVTNNEIVLQQAPYPCISVCGDTEDVLVKVRDLIHTGYRLLSYPLGASIKMLHSPVTSVLLSENSGPMDPESVEILERSVEMLHATLGERKPEERHRKDYEIVDWHRLQAAMSELNRF